MTSLKKETEKFLNRYAPEKLSGKLAPAFMAAASAFAGELNRQFPQKNIRGFVSDLYGLLDTGGGAVTDTIASVLLSLGSEKQTKKYLDQAVAVMKQPANALLLATTVQAGMHIVTFEDFSAFVQARAEEMVKSGGFPPDLSAQILMSTRIVLPLLKPHYESFRDGALEDSAASVARALDLVPTAMLASAIHAQAKAVSPESVEFFISQSLDALPRPAFVARQVSATFRAVRDGWAPQR